MPRAAWRGRCGPARWRRVIDSMLCSMPFGDDALATEQRRVLEAYGVALADLGEDLHTNLVDEGDAGRHENARPEVGVAPADRRRDVHHRGHAGRDQRLRAHPVEVEVVEDRDVAAAEPLGEVLRTRVEPCHSGDAGERCGTDTPQGRELHGIADTATQIGLPSAYGPLGVADSNHQATFAYAGNRSGPS